MVRFSGDSGDGMQLTGMQFTDTTAFLGQDLNTFPDYPSEIRAPAGTVAGVSGFQVNFGSKEIFTPGDQYDVLVVMNAAALKVDLPRLKKGGIIIANRSGFDAKNLKLAHYPSEVSPLEDNTLENYIVYGVDITKHTREALSGLGMGTKEIERSKNMFVLGLLFWLFDKSMHYTISFIKEKFRDAVLAEANLRALHAGWNFGENTEIFTTRFKISAAKLPPGVYRNVTGNHATAIGLIAAAEKSGLSLFLGSYPITPASDILHELSRYKANDVKTFQAEDEIAGICAAIGASYAGSLGVTTTSGPGFSLKMEALGLATMLEIPLVVVNVQRGGPSTGLPTKTEQSDLMQAMYGRHGEAPLPVLAAASPSDCFEVIYEACRIAVEHMTPVIFLSDGYIANGSEPWRFPTEDQLKKIKTDFLRKPNTDEGVLLPYKRDERLVRPWIIPGTVGLEHRIGGLEKQHETGNASHDAKNHELMVRLRAEKIERIADTIAPAIVEGAAESDDLLVLSWGSTYGAIRTAVSELLQEGRKVSHIHLRHLNPFPANLGTLLSRYKKILIPEMNNGQLIRLIKAHYLLPAKGFNKIQGQPFTVSELKLRITAFLEEK